MKTLREARRQHDLAQEQKRERRIHSAVRDPLVVAVLDQFPGAEIVEVRDVEPVSHEA